ncbi:hypothetical protein ZWY2020_057322 [Hordeum vulgare]|nr:hypothetical protein ZWY2020_057322 [Hordeum vulgare]
MSVWIDHFKVQNKLNVQVGIQKLIACREPLSLCLTGAAVVHPSFQRFPLLLMKPVTWLLCFLPQGTASSSLLTAVSCQPSPPPLPLLLHCIATISSTVSAIAKPLRCRHVLIWLAATTPSSSTPPLSPCK